MTPDQLRWLWTFVTGFGSIVALLNLREARLDNWAVTQVDAKRGEIMRLVAMGEVEEQWIISGGLCFEFLAGVSAIIGFSQGALIALVLSAAAFTVLSIYQARRRRNVFHRIRMSEHWRGEEHDDG